MKKVFNLLMRKIVLLVCLATSMFYFSCSNDNEDNENQSQTIPLKVKLNETNLTLYIDETYVLRPIVESGDMETDKIEWNSSNSEVATVIDGVISAVSVGESTITLSYENNICASCLAKVLPISPTSLNLNYHELTLQIGESGVLTTSVEPSNATDVTITWESSDTNIAFVDSTGMVTAVSIGEAIIKAVVNNSEVYDQCRITVSPINVTGIKCQESAKILRGGSVKIEAAVIPENATDNSITWYSIKPEIATISDGGIATGVMNGTTYVIAKTNDGGYEGSCRIEVCDIDNFVTAIASVGSEGSTASYFYSYLKLLFKTNVESFVFLSSIKLYDNYGELQGEEHPNVACSEYSHKFITAYHFGPVFSFDTFRAIGWKFIISYTWNGKEYELEYVHL